MRLLILAAILTAPLAGAADFEADIRPLLASKCLACHSEASSLGGLSVETRESALRGGAEGPSVVAGQPDRSPLVTRLTLPAGAPGAMPPGGPRVSEAEISALRDWISDGAEWPAPLRAAIPEEGAAPDDEELALVRQIRARIVQQARADDGGFEAYDEAVDGSDVSLRMVPIAAGEFLMGTPPSEPGRGDDEGPQRRVRVDAFWMGAHEISWDAFRRFMLRQATVYLDPDKVAAAVSSPTPPYVEMSFGMGVSGFPAISMTQHAASKYAQWLSAKTGRFYRLPTEAEWEYACRAGTDSAYSFGSDPADLAEHGWYFDNSGAQYREIGTRQPNAWGLFDMHGNVWEWTLDRHGPYETSGETIVNPWRRADRLYPRVARGGSWYEDPPALRCGARKASDDSWKMQDPQLPKSIWYHTDAQWLGFRLVRPRELPTAEMMHAYWNSAADKN